MDERLSMNAKIRKGAKVGRRVRSCGRWGVWVCTVLLTAFVLFSTWFSVSVSLQPASRAVAMEHGNVFIGVGVVWSSVSVWYNYEPEKSLIELYLDESIRTGYNLHHDSIKGRWKSPNVWRLIPRVHKSTLFGQTSQQVQFSLLYPTVLMLGWSLWLVRGRWKLRWPIGCCRVCGYSLEGLASDVCPECGEVHEA